MPIILIIIGLLLIYLNFKAIRKDDNSFGNVLKYKKEDISDLELKIGEVRKDMAESLLEIQQEILELKNHRQIDDNKVENKINQSKDEELEDIESNDEEIDEKAYLLGADEGVINNIAEKSKTERIKELLEMGFSEDEICEKLSLGKGEVLLVKGLFKK
ncbi:hypothetical protein NNC19_00275 [Clostridium sp. SHJSY1]|uniref:hypothetical protein n=1 Tax=Clostridium sp. SHJSY1 TaxID=2942483 RepID=UPI0028762B31|nr:hypothetical protein [Clostridium sp. SHJSY1]MDS0524089.1 hypothetical protein [Clostridium sp. SHJSY1]